MKKTFLVLLAFLLIFTLFGCNKAQNLGIAFICGENGVEERFEGQALKAAIDAYCTENGIPYFEYISDGTEDYYSNAAQMLFEKLSKIHRRYSGNLGKTVIGDILMIMLRNVF